MSEEKKLLEAEVNEIDGDEIIHEEFEEESGEDVFDGEGVFEDEEEEGEAE